MKIQAAPDPIPSISPIGRIVGVIEDHLELVALELRYEAERGEKRLLIFVSVAGCILLALGCLQAAMIVLLLRAGAPLDAVCAVFGVLWGVVGVLAYRHAGNRDAQAGEPFEGSRIEIRKTLQWIRQHTS